MYANSTPTIVSIPVRESEETIPEIRIIPAITPIARKIRRFVCQRVKQKGKEKAKADANPAGLSKLPTTNDLYGDDEYPKACDNPYTACKLLRVNISKATLLVVGSSSSIFFSVKRCIIAAIIKPIVIVGSNRYHFAENSASTNKLEVLQRAPPKRIDSQNKAGTDFI